MKNITVFTTGGTICMKYDEEKKGLVPAVTGKDLIEGVPQLDGVANISVVEFAQVSSPEMTPAIMKNLGDKIEEAFANGADGVVVTHGTDTLEETAYFLNLYVRSDKPVCIVGAMRGAADLSAEGPRNIYDAIRTAACDDAQGLGTLVVMNEEIHLGSTVTKTSTCNVDTFKSPVFGACGYADVDKIVIRTKPYALPKLHPEKLELNVPILKAYTGMDSSFLEYLATTDIKGLVIEGFGRGNIPSGMLAGLQKVLDKGVIVICSSRANSGKTLGVYAYGGAGAVLEGMGVILSKGHNTLQSRLKLMLALGLTTDKEEIAKLFA